MPAERLGVGQAVPEQASKQAEQHRAVRAARRLGHGPPQLAEVLQPVPVAADALDGPLRGRAAGEESEALVDGRAPCGGDAGAERDEPLRGGGADPGPCKHGQGHGIRYEARDGKMANAAGK